MSGAEVTDAVAFILLQRIRPDDAVDDRRWESEAAAVYAATGLLVPAKDCRAAFYGALRMHGCRDKAIEAIRGALQAAVKAQGGPTPVLPRKAVRAEGGVAAADRAAPKEALTAASAIVGSLYGADTFRFPVAPGVIMTYNHAELGPYSSVVRRPSSLSTIDAGIESGAVRTARDAEAKIRLIAANCVMFNAPEGDFPLLARSFASGASRELHQAVATFENGPPSAVKPEPVGD